MHNDPSLIEAFKMNALLLHLIAADVSGIIERVSLLLLNALFGINNSLWIMDPHSRAPKENTGHENEVLPQGTTHLSYHVTNEEVRAKIQQAIGPNGYFLIMVKKRKLQ